MTKATEAQHDAAYNAYYKAVNDWSVQQRGQFYVVAKRPDFIAPSMAGPETECFHQFDDKITADRYLITKILAEITDAVVAAQ